MHVRVYDRRTLSSRWIDAPFPLAPELTLSLWVGDPPDRAAHRGAEHGRWQHDVYRRTGPEEYAFIGTAPNAGGEPQFETVPWLDRDDPPPRLCRHCHARL